MAMIDVAHVRRIGVRGTALALGAAIALGSVAVQASLLRAAAGQAQFSRLGKGKFLVASRSLRDPNFAQSVILLVDYDEEGALGVVVNQPTPVRLGDALPQVDVLRERHDVVYIGGPVGRNRMMLLLRAPTEPEDSTLVFERVYASGSLDALRQSVQRGDGVRAYAGYAGWGPGQLDAEVARGDWLIGPAESALIFDARPARVWTLLLERFSGDWAGLQPAAGRSMRAAADG
ncbi:MAG: YqgE/AlgH family protein [Candidatus Binatia bacterium]